MTRVSKNKREKYGQINITWWEKWGLGNGYLGYFSDALWWLRDVITFRVGDDPIKIPIGSVVEDEDLNAELKVQFTEIEDFDSPKIHHTAYRVKNFPRIGDYNTYQYNGNFQMVLFGEEDKINITQDEFFNAGGSARIDWDVETYDYYVLFQPPSSPIGINENFSITLEGSIPAMFIQQSGYMLVKKTTPFYTEFYGKTNNTLDVELGHITSYEFLYTSAQRLLEKYSYGNTSFSVDYSEEEIHIIDNKKLIPQSVSIDLNGKRTTNNAFIYNSLDSIPQKPLSELGSTEHTLDDVQFYPLAFLS